jgi:hypothetical protein
MTANYPNYPDGSTAASAGGDVGGSSGAKEQAQQVAGAAADQTRQVAGTAAEETRHVAGVAQGEAAKVASEATSQVRGLVSEATSQVEDQSRTQLGRLAETLRTFGEDLEKMASQSDGPAAGLAGEAADRVHGLASQLQGREPRELVDEVRRFARRRPGAFLVGALAAGVVAGRLTRGAKAAQDGTSSRSTPFGGVQGSPYDSVRASEVTSPGQPVGSGIAAPSSGPILDTSTQGHGTATGDPLAGTGTPVSAPVYPQGAEGGRP